MHWVSTTSRIFNSILELLKRAFDILSGSKPHSFCQRHTWLFCQKKWLTCLTSKAGHTYLFAIIWLQWDLVYTSAYGVTIFQYMCISCITSLQVPFTKDFKMMCYLLCTHKSKQVCLHSTVSPSSIFWTVLLS